MKEVTIQQVEEIVLNATVYAQDLADLNLAPLKTEELSSSNSDC